MSKVFLRNKDVEKTAFMNWRMSKFNNIENLLALAEGYMESALELVNKCLDNNDDKKADGLIFPILFNTNHGIELYLKSILWSLNLAYNTGYKLEKGHNIKQLYETVVSRINTHQGVDSRKNFVDYTAQLKEYIDETFSVNNSTPKDNKLDFPRYPISNKYDNHFYVGSTENIVVNLENLRNVITEIHETLNDRTLYFYYQILRQEY